MAKWSSASTGTMSAPALRSRWWRRWAWACWRGATGAGRACPICAKILYPIYADLTALPREERGHLGYALAARFSEIDGQRVPVRHRRRQRQRWIDGLAQLMQRETELPPPAGDLMAWGTSIPRGKYRGRCG